MMQKNPQTSAKHPQIPANRPRIGITPNLDERDLRVRRAYIDCITRAGGLPFILAPARDMDDAALEQMVQSWVELCEGFVFTGGDDPSMEPFGEPTHPKATPIDPLRQRVETVLLRYLDRACPETPVLGVCLGMQMMGLVSGGTLNQHMPDDTPSHAAHWSDRAHAIRAASGDIPADRRLEGVVTSHHRQALRTAGQLRVLSVAEDGVIEAVDHPARRFWIGVQWHPERSGDGALGQGLFDELVRACLAGRESGGKR